MQRVSERVGPTGSLQGEGLENILGRPPFDPLTLVLRESAQNAWDARLRGPAAGVLDAVPALLVRIRTLDAAQRKVLRRVLSAGDPRHEEPAHTDPVQIRLADPSPVRVLEIIDYGTRGLEGPVDPQSGAGNFVRFFFDVGAAHSGGEDGGTYGYGRSSLYLAGLARTILVDSVLHSDNSRRFMACRIGRSYEKALLQGGRARFTGRHFWGVPAQGDRVAPLVGEAARDLAVSLGMPSRTGPRSGTSILVPWPDLRNGDDAERIARILLHNLWPKLVSGSGRFAMSLSVQDGETAVPVSDPAKHPYYRLFAEALLTARTGIEGLGAKPIWVQKPAVLTGHIAFVESQRPHGVAEINASRPEQIFDNGMHHVALMRPAELVVRYADYSGAGSGNDWAGVFRCTEEKEVVDAFAKAEPPAHDDWIPDRLEGNAATLVRVTTNRRIPEAVNARFGNAHSGASARMTLDHSLASAADNFAAEFLAGDGSGAVPGTQASGSSSGGGGPKLKRPSLESLRREQGYTVARFRTALSGVAAAYARATVLIEGTAGAELPPDVQPPRVLGWLQPDGTLSEGRDCPLIPGVDVFVDIAFGGEYAVVPVFEVLLAKPI